MSQQEVVEVANQLREFFETRAVCKKGLLPLKERVEIGLVLERANEFRLFRVGDVPHFENGKAKNPDVIFELTLTGARTLIEFQGDDVGKLGIAVLEQYLAKQLKIRVPGSLFSVMANGYLGVVKAGGMDFARFLASHGVSSLKKIPGIIKDLKTP